MAWAGIEPHLRGLSPEQMTKVLESVSRHNAYYWRVRPPVESGKEPVVFDHLDRSACERFVQAVYRDESMWEGFFHAIMNVSMSENDAADAIENICGIIDDELVKECSPGRRRDSPARFVSRFMTALQESACLRGPFVRMAVECHYLYPRALRMREIGDTVEIPTRLEADLLRSLRTSILSYAREKLPGWLNIIRWRLRRFVCDATGRSLVSADMRRLRDFLDSRSDDEILRPS